MTRSVKLVRSVFLSRKIDKKTARRQWKHDKQTNPTASKEKNPRVMEVTLMGRHFVDEERWCDEREIQNMKQKLKNKWKRMEVRNFCSE